MAGYFEDKLIDLLPPIYQEMDTSGDLKAFLSIPAVTLDEIKALIDQFPSLFDVDTCREDFLPMLALLVGYRYDPLRDPLIQRREIRDAIETHRRKGTIPAILRTLQRNGWRGKIDETYQKAFRLNRRCRLSKSKLSGRIYSLGVYRVESENLVSNLRELLSGNHPAGMKVFFLQWLRMLGCSAEQIQALIGTIVTTTIPARRHDTLALNRSRLNSQVPLTTKQMTWSYWRITDQVSVDQGISGAAIRILRWHARSFGPMLNSLHLNSSRLPESIPDDRRVTYTSLIETGSNSVSRPVVMKLGSHHLGKARLATAIPCW
jgi:phage tail-like protein